MLNREDKRVTEHGLLRVVKFWLMRSAKKLMWLSQPRPHENQWPQIQHMARTFLLMFQLLPISLTHA